MFVMVKKSSGILIHHDLVFPTCDPLTIYSIIMPFDYVFENIMENGVFALLKQKLHFS